MLKDEYLLAKIGVDIAENEPKVEVWSNEWLVLLILSPEDGSFGVDVERRRALVENGVEAAAIPVSQVPLVVPEEAAEP